MSPFGVTGDTSRRGTDLILRKLSTGVNQNIGNVYQYDFEPNSRNSLADAFDRSGLWINASANGYRVDGVVAGSPAAQAGIRLGDLIITIGGQAAKGLTLAEARDLLRDSAPGTLVRMSVRSGGRLTEVLLRLRDQI